MLEVVHETGSTNADLAARLASGEVLAEGFWLIADRQTGGRGRLGRVWQDGGGNFMGSTVVRRQAGDPPLPSLALACGVAVQAALAPLLPAMAQPQLKWPNDVMLDGAKLAGLLLESVGEVAVLGVGVNLAQAPDLPDRPATALARFGPAPDRDLFATALAAALAEELARWRAYGLAPLVARWQAVAHPPGTPLVVRGVADAPLAGEFAGLADDGALRLRLADGTTRLVHAGEVMVG
ncbi:MAG: biotin--[acetyl-CoA-carboxylase] ligase [Proteobacteria bacterium]|nr:biotin--[acetyl-CoA-carboxylase] ligase [Pseudomonadota bacterium]